MLNTQDRHTTAQDGRSYRKLSRLLDNSIPLPGGMRIGLDGLLGLIPGVGDAVGSMLSMFILYEAHQRNAPKIVLLRMILNIAIDAFIGAIPILGDIFDFFWKANEKNARLLDAYDRDPRRTYRRSAASSAALLIAMVALIIGIIYLTVALFTFIWRQLV